MNKLVHNCSNCEFIELCKKIKLDIPENISHPCKYMKSSNRIVETLSMNEPDISSVIRPLRSRLSNTPNAEQQFYKQATDKGWNVLRVGWPDYLIYKDNKIVFVEVKDGSDKLKPSQVKMLDILSDHGLVCYVWKPKAGFQKYNKPTPFKKLRRLAK